MSLAPLARISVYFAAASLLMSLAACGGGGDGGNSVGSPAPAPAAPVPPSPASQVAVVPASGTLRTAAAVPSYAASSQQVGFFNALNAVRAAAGAGYVDQSTKIDVASQAHADYLTANPAEGHVEDPAKPRFYADTVAARLTKAGYSFGLATEVIGGTGASLSASDCVLGLMDTVYHAAALLSEETGFGVGIGSDAAGVPLCVSDLAAASTDTYGQVPSAGALIAYPYDGQTDVLDAFCVSCELPRPSPALFPDPAPVTYTDLGGVLHTYQPSAEVGTPIIVRLRNADFVNAQAAGTLAATVTQFSLTDAGGNTVPAAILAATDVTGSGVTLNSDSNLGDGFVVLVPLSPLSVSTTYTAHFSATLTAGGAALAKTWSFTTGS